MHFDCRFSNAQFTGNLFIQLAGDHVLKHFPLARCVSVSRRAQISESLACSRRVPASF